MGTLEITVLDENNCFLEYIHPAIARKLLKEKLAVVYSHTPFIIKVKDRKSLSFLKEKGNMAITNYTEYFKVERDVFVQNVSNCQVSVGFEVGPGHSESYLFTASKDPVNLTRHIPFHAIKSSMDLRKMLNRVPAALKLLTEEEFMGFYKKQADLTNKTLDEALDAAEMKRTAIHNHQPLPDAEEPVKPNDVPQNVKSASEEDVINPRILNLCLQVHPSVPDQSKMSAQAFLSELDSVSDMSLDDWSYVQAHGYYKSVTNLAKKKVAQLANEAAEEVTAEEAKPTAKKAAKQVAAK